MRAETVQNGPVGDLPVVFHFGVVGMDHLDPHVKVALRTTPPRAVKTHRIFLGIIPQSLIINSTK